jgi:calmodulin
MKKNTVGKGKQAENKWNFPRMREGYNPVDLQREDKEGTLKNPNELLDADSEYFQGKFHFSEEQLNYYRQVFKFFDRTGGELLDLSELGLAMRAAGALVTEAEVKILSTRIDPYNSGTCELKDFLLCMYQCSQKDDSESKIKTAFSAFDKDKTGFIEADELKHVLSCFGESLTDQEIEAFFSSLTIQPNNTVALKDLVKLLDFTPNYK